MCILKEITIKSLTPTAIKITLLCRFMSRSLEHEMQVKVSVYARRVCQGQLLYARYDIYSVYSFREKCSALLIYVKVTEA